MRNVAVILFDGFETLDAFGPVEVLGRLSDHFQIEFFSREGGAMTSTHHVRTLTLPFSEIAASETGGLVLLVPGGIGTRALIADTGYPDRLTSLAGRAEFVLTVCTGSVLLSKTGLLDGKRATTNKRLFAWAREESPAVRWVKKARWVRDGRYYTSSGVSAGTDMALGFVADLFGRDLAKRQADEIEFDWKENPDWDPFADMW
jgi:putative intracellular protease/amidase